MDPTQELLSTLSVTPAYYHEKVGDHFVVFGRLGGEVRPLASCFCEGSAKIHIQELERKYPAGLDYPTGSRFDWERSTSDAITAASDCCRAGR